MLALFVNLFKLQGNLKMPIKTKKERFMIMQTNQIQDFADAHHRR